MFFVFILILNLLICWSNCRVTGKIWDTTKGGLSHIVTWCGFLQGLLGFSWCFLFVEAWAYQHIFPAGVGEHHKYILTDRLFLILMKMGYLTLAPGLILTGLVIWVQSLVTAWKTRQLGDIAVAGWNSYAQISKTIDFARSAKPFWEDVLSFFKSDNKDDEDNGSVILVCVLLAIAVLGGIITGTLIMTNARASERRQSALEVREVLQRRPGRA